MDRCSDGSVCALAGFLRTELERQGVRPLPEQSHLKLSVSSEPTEVRFALPRRSWRSLVNAQLCMAPFVLAFTSVWTYLAATAGAPLPFVLFSTPFWFSGAQLLRAELQPMLSEHWLVVHTQGIQLLSCASVFGFAQLVTLDELVPWGTATMQELLQGLSEHSSPSTSFKHIAPYLDVTRAEWGYLNAVVRAAMEQASPLCPLFGSSGSRPGPLKGEYR
mmetsp:Transcript_41421/g.88347  ORF Transcript_41421/g.88347 Transcript_41421/m.88347 type:complete len:219 (-) Transcript_41421:128-784(-)